MSAAVQGLEELRQEGARRMAELAALSLERLLALARSLLACFRDGQPTNDNIHWPAVPELQAMLLQSQVSPAPILDLFIFMLIFWYCKKSQTCFGGNKVPGCHCGTAQVCTHELTNMQGRHEQREMRRRRGGLTVIRSAGAGPSGLRQSGFSHALVQDFFCLTEACLTFFATCGEQETKESKTPR